MVSKEFFFTAISSNIGSLIYLIVSKILDNYINPVASDIIGKSIDISMDFIFQSYIFLNKIDKSKIPLYLLGKFISTSTSVLLFYLYIKYFRNPNIDNTFVRIIISVSVFFIIAFPFTKYVLFKN